MAVALLGAGGVGTHAALSNSGSSAPTGMPKSYPDTGSLAPSASPVPTTSPRPTPSATAPTHHAAAAALRLTITGSVSWIEVRRASGRVLVSGMVRHGHHLTYAHGPLDVVIGNAGAVQLSRDGHSPHRAGKLGEVVRFSVRGG